MSNETTRMLDTSLELDSQHAKLHRTQTTYNSYSSSIDQSGLLVKKLKDVHRLNRIRVYGAYYFFFAVVAYIWLRRLGVVGMLQWLLGWVPFLNFGTQVPAAPK